MTRFIGSAARLLANPARWCRYEMAMDEQGNDVGVFEPVARMWCLFGALEACHPDIKNLRDAISRVQRVIRRDYPNLPSCLTLFNDHPSTTHEMVVYVLREANA